MTDVTRKTAQALARFFLLLLPLAAGLAGQGCASPRAAGADAPGPAPAIDAVLPAGDGWRLFRLGALRHATAARDPETGVLSPPASASHSGWQTLASPSGPFRPVQAIPAQFGYFLLVDAASGRLCLYDSAAALIATSPLPEPFTPFPAGRAAVFRGADNAFTFVDYAAGEAWQFADRQTSGAGQTQWIPRGRVKLPAGTRACMQPPGSAELFCRGGDGSPLRFDGALNRVPAHRADARGGRTAAVWVPASGEWALEGRAEDGTALFRFLPSRRLWETIPPPDVP